VVGLSAAGGRIHREVAKLIGDYAYIIIDCPPAMDSPVPQSALLVADLGLVPVIPSPLDLWAAVGIRQVIERIKDVNDRLQAWLVINELEPRTSLAKEAKEILKGFGLPLMRTALHHRTVYRQSAVFGGIVHQLGNRAARAIGEVEALTDEVLALLGGPRSA